MSKVKQKDSLITKERTGYPALLYENVRKIAKGLLGKGGFASVDMISSWNAVVGEKIGKCSVPLKIKFPKEKNTGGVLHIMVGGSAFVQYIAYQKLTVLEKVNQYLGYEAVTDLKIIPGLYVGNAEDAKPKSVVETNQTPAETKEKPASESLQAVLDSMENDDLKQRLRRLAKMYISDND